MFSSIFKDWCRAYAHACLQRQFGKLPQSVFDKIQAALSQAAPKRAAAGKSPRYVDGASDSPHGTLRTPTRVGHACEHMHKVTR